MTSDIFAVKLFFYKIFFCVRDAFLLRTNCIFFLFCLYFFYFQCWENQCSKLKSCLKFKRLDNQIMFFFFFFRLFFYIHTSPLSLPFSWCDASPGIGRIPPSPTPHPHLLFREEGGHGRIWGPFHYPHSRPPLALVASCFADASPPWRKRFPLLSA